jgi:hypothetical protein
MQSTQCCDEVARRPGRRLVHQVPALLHAVGEGVSRCPAPVQHFAAAPGSAIRVSRCWVGWGSEPQPPPAGTTKTGCETAHMASGCRYQPAAASCTPALLMGDPRNAIWFTGLVALVNWSRRYRAASAATGPSLHVFMSRLPFSAAMAPAARADHPSRAGKHRGRCSQPSGR